MNTGRMYKIPLITIFNKVNSLITSLLLLVRLTSISLDSCIIIKFSFLETDRLIALKVTPQLSIILL